MNDKEKALFDENERRLLIRKRREEKNKEISELDERSLAFRYRKLLPKKNKGNNNSSGNNNNSESNTVDDGVEEEIKDEEGGENYFAARIKRAMTLGLLYNDDNDEGLDENEGDEEEEFINDFNEEDYMSEEEEISPYNRTTTMKTLTSSKFTLIQQLQNQKLHLKQAEKTKMSKRYIKERRQKQEEENDCLYLQIFQEAKQMQKRCLTCVDEANLFSKMLGKTTNYRIVGRDAREDATWKMLLMNNQQLGSSVTIPLGTGRRIEKMVIEVTEFQRETRFLPTEHFFREHGRLQHEIKRIKAVLPLAPSSKSLSSSSSFRQRDGLAASSESVGGGAASRNSRQEIELKLKEILDGTVQKAKLIQAQIEEIRALGWNAF